jgi:hypothetical protein
MTYGEIALICLPTGLACLNAGLAIWAYLRVRQIERLHALMEAICLDAIDMGLAPFPLTCALGFGVGSGTRHD